MCHLLCHVCLDLVSTGHAKGHLIKEALKLPSVVRDKAEGYKASRTHQSFVMQKLKAWNDIQKVSANAS